MKSEILAGLGIVGVITVLMFWILCIIVAWMIGTFVAGFFDFTGVLWWVCSIMFTLIILGLVSKLTGD
jgi:hypothetical protein